MPSSEDSLSPQRRGSATENGDKPPEKRKRVRNWTADDRAAHRVFERSRREAFKERLTSLASLLPSQQAMDANRLSKHVVIDESIHLHRLQQQQLSDYQQQVDILRRERDYLLDEVNRWRTAAGLELKHPSSAVQITEEITRPAPLASMLVDDIGFDELQGSSQLSAGMDDPGASTSMDQSQLFGFELGSASANMTIPSPSPGENTIPLGSSWATSLDMMAAHPPNIVQTNIGFHTPFAGLPQSPATPGSYMSTGSHFQIPNTSRDRMAYALHPAQIADPLGFLDNSGMPTR